MANTVINILPMDFITIKNDFKVFLKSQTRYKDYNFDGSNWSVVMDMLAYNSFRALFYTNMIGTEMFLDSAQLHDSIVSHAKELNYVPRSNISAVLNVNIAIDTGDAFSAVISPYTPFSGRVGSNVYTFSTNSQITAISSNTTIPFSNVAIYEGIVVAESFVMDSANLYQKFIISNPGIDTSSLAVVVSEDSGSSNLTYLQATSLFDLNANSQVYFVQGSSSNKYELIFGDNVVGRKPADGATIFALYRISSGDFPNGLSVITPVGLVGGYSNVFLTVLGAASGGAFQEDGASVQFNAPKAFTTQERAVSDGDYETLLRRNFPEIRAVAAFGGDELSPPIYGKVFISVEITNVDGIPDSKKTQYTNFLRTRNSVTIIPVIINPDFIYVDVNTIAKYNINKTQLDDETIRSEVSNAINNYNNINLNDFKTTLTHSEMETDIDDCDVSMVSNETTLRLIKLLTPIAGISQNFGTTFNQPLQDDLPPLEVTHNANSQHTIISSTFLVNGKTVVLEDNGNGIINLAETTLSIHKIISSIGTIDYSTGIITINNIKPQTGNVITLYAVAKSKDLTGQQNIILKIRPQDITISIVQLRI